MAHLELTLAIIKPHIIKNPWAVSKIRDLILSSQFQVVRFKRELLDVKDVREFYMEHNNKFFYNRLVTFMTR